MTVNEKILRVIDQAHQLEPARGISRHAERILNDVTSRKKYELRQSKITNGNGVEVDLFGEVMAVINHSYYIGRSEAGGAKFVSQFAAPTKQQRDAIKAKTFEALERLVDIHGICFLDKEAEHLW